MRDLVVAACLLLGLGLMLTAAIGLLRLPDLLCRSHAVAKASAREGPHRRGHDRGRGAARRAEAGRRCGRADQRQHRHRARLRLRGQGLQADPDHARDHVVERRNLLRCSAPSWC
jgi:hypothetical protein